MTKDKNREKEKEYVSTQISRYMTDKKLVETLANLNVAPPQKFARLHAKGDVIGDNRVYSVIKLNVQDYSKGTGENMVKANFNLLPSDIMYLFVNICKGIKDFKFEREKIFASDKNDATVSKLSIIRSSTDSEGKARKYAWYIKVENGIGEAAKTTNGGTYCKKGSYNALSSVYINLNDEDFFKLMYDTKKFIDIWELTNCPALIRTGMQMYECQRTEESK